MKPMPALIGTLMAASLAAASPALAQEVVGSVKTVTGDAVVIDSGRAVKAQPGTPIRKGNTLKTAPASSMGVTFTDNTVMSFGPDTELTVEEYLYAPGKANAKFGSKLSKGSLAAVSGAIAKLRPDAVEMKTATGTIGIRGTHFVVRAEE
jgi:hypothetical protein